MHRHTALLKRTRDGRTDDSLADGDMPSLPVTSVRTADWSVAWRFPRVPSIANIRSAMFEDARRGTLMIIAAAMNITTTVVGPSCLFYCLLRESRSPPTERSRSFILPSRDCSDVISLPYLYARSSFLRNFFVSTRAVVASTW